MDVFVIVVLGIATTYLCLMLGMFSGGLIGQRTGRLSSWKVLRWVAVLEVNGGCASSIWFYLEEFFTDIPTAGTPCEG